MSFSFVVLGQNKQTKQINTGFGKHVTESSFDLLLILDQIFDGRLIENKKTLSRIHVNNSRSAWTHAATMCICVFEFCPLHPALLLRSVCVKDQDWWFVIGASDAIHHLTFAPPTLL